MGKPTKIFAGGALMAILIFTGGVINSHRIESNVRELEARCIEHGQRDESEWGQFELVCDAESLGLNSPGIQGQVAKAYRNAQQSKKWSRIVAGAVIVISIIPLVWYFLLRRVRELRDAIAGK